ncbi:MAG: glucokinase [Polyangiaceae bacterium]|nr:glucokinase [Polyangiaceae bacterium]
MKSSRTTSRARVDAVLAGDVGGTRARFALSCGPIRHGFAYGLPWPPSPCHVLVRAEAALPAHERGRPAAAASWQD